MPCSCIVCTGATLESLPWYTKYLTELNVLQAKLNSGEIDQDEYDDYALPDLKDYHDAKILEYAITYGEGKCLYRMYRVVLKIFKGEMWEMTKNEEILKQKLVCLLTDYHPLSYIEWAFDRVLEL